MADDQDPAEQSQQSQQGGGDGGDGKRPAWAADLKAEILGAVREIVAPVREGGSAQQAAQRHETGKLETEANLDDKITAAIERIGKARADQDAAKSVQDRLDAIEAAMAEVVPVERGRAHNLMGWGEPG
jgi:hypothetical protein